jgi:hypothetical protein
VTSVARVLASFLPAAMPLAMPITFFITPPIAVPITSSDGCTQNWAFSIARASRERTRVSAQASVTPHGRSVAISRANDGPESTAITTPGRVSASTSGISAQLSSSIPFEQVTTGVPAVMHGRMSAATPRTCCAGTAITMKSLSRLADARSFVAVIPGTRPTPPRNSALVPSRLIPATTSGSRAR